MKLPALPARGKALIAAVVALFLLLAFLTRGTKALQRAVLMDGLLELLVIAGALFLGVPWLYALALGAAVFVGTTAWQVARSAFGIGGGGTGGGDIQQRAAAACQGHGGVRAILESSMGARVECKDGSIQPL